MLSVSEGQPAAAPSAAQVEQIQLEIEQQPVQDSRLSRTERIHYAEFAAQHFSASWGVRTVEFAIYLGLVEAFPNSLLPAALYGFATSAAGVFLSNWVGSLVDRFHQLRLVQCSIAAQKITAIGLAVLMIGLFQVQTSPINAAQKGILAALVVFGCLNKLATILNTVAVEREWAVTISNGATSRLTILNTWLRRCDLCTKLVAPLFASLLLSVASYTIAFAVLAAVDGLTMIFELLWVGRVYNRFVRLFQAQLLCRLADKTRKSALSENELRAHFFDTYRQDWAVFVRHPVFLSSLSISLLYFTTLSFDGIFISWLRIHNWSNAFIAGMRSVTVLTGLIGTLLMPFLEKKIGLVRAGNWSIWSELLCLVPVLLSFFIAASPAGAHGPIWGSVIMFAGIQLSRIGLWSYDLCQMKTALQYSLQNLGDLTKYAMVLVLSRPSQFKWTALASVAAVASGTFVYTADATSHSQSSTPSQLTSEAAFPDFSLTCSHLGVTPACSPVHSYHLGMVIDAPAHVFVIRDASSATPTASTKVNLGAVLGGSLGGAALIAFIMLCLYKRQQNDTPDQPYNRFNANQRNPQPHLMQQYPQDPYSAMGPAYPNAAQPFMEQQPPPYSADFQSPARQPKPKHKQSNSAFAARGPPLSRSAGSASGLGYGYPAQAPSGYFSDPGLPSGRLPNSSRRDGNARRGQHQQNGSAFSAHSLPGYGSRQHVEAWQAHRHSPGANGGYSRSGHV